MGKVKAADSRKWTEENMKKVQVSTSDVNVNNEICTSQNTPTKTLQIVSPLPTIHQKVSKGKQNVKVLTSEGHLTVRRLFEEKKKTQHKKQIIPAPKRNKNSSKILSSPSSESDEELQFSLTSEECSDENENTCVECQESYYHTKKKSDWIQCVQCFGWLHEDCTGYQEKCNSCGAKNKGKGKGKKAVK